MGLWFQLTAAQADLSKAVTLLDESAGLDMGKSLIEPECWGSLLNSRLMGDALMRRELLDNATSRRSQLLQDTLKKHFLKGTTNVHLD